MMKIRFPDEGGISFKFPKDEMNKKQRECFARMDEILAKQSQIDPTLAFVLGIAASKGPKVFERVTQALNVA